MLGRVEANDILTFPQWLGYEQRGMRRFRTRRRLQTGLRVGTVWPFKPWIAELATATAQDVQAKKDSKVFIVYPETSEHFTADSPSCAAGSTDCVKCASKIFMFVVCM
jgi:hypothetical protein